MDNSYFTFTQSQLSRWQLRKLTEQGAAVGAVEVTPPSTSATPTDNTPIATSDPPSVSSG